MYNMHMLAVLCIFSGFVIRFLLLCNSSVTKILGNRIEISTPVSSWKRVTEGVNLYKIGIDPYDGDAFHESPLSLLLYDYIVPFSDLKTAVIFSVCDILIAILLYFASNQFLKQLVKKEHENPVFVKNAPQILLPNDQLYTAPFYVAVTYLFSPFSIASCCGKSTVIFLNLLIALFILLVSLGKWVLASFVLAIATYHSVYPVTLFVPVVLYILKDQRSSFDIKVADLLRLIPVTVTFISTMSALLYTSYLKEGSWNFLLSTYGFIFSVPDLTPNIGLFWYFFTEMFDHFRTFFLWTFQLNCFIYAVPLAIRFRNDPLLILFINLMIIAIFKPYPCIGDVALYLSLIPIWKHLFSFNRQSFIVGCILASCTLLAPTLWHLWIYSGSANANFYFAITLAFNTGQIFLLTDVLSAYIKREYFLMNGIKGDKEGKLPLLRLQ